MTKSRLRLFVYLLVLLAAPMALAQQWTVFDTDTVNNLVMEWRQRTDSSSRPGYDYRVTNNNTFPIYEFSIGKRKYELQNGGEYTVSSEHWGTIQGGATREMIDYDHAGYGAEQAGSTLTGNVEIETADTRFQFDSQIILFADRRIWGTNTGGYANGGGGSGGGGSGGPGGGATAVTISGADYNYVGPLVVFTADEVDNGSANTINAELQLWATNAPYNGGTITGHRVASAELLSISSGSKLTNISVSGTAEDVPNGTYNMTVLVVQGQTILAYQSVANSTFTTDSGGGGNGGGIFDDFSSEEAGGCAMNASGKSLALLSVLLLSISLIVRRRRMAA